MLIGKVKAATAGRLLLVYLVCGRRPRRWA
jgi:uncharacterized membrane protein